MGRGLMSRLASGEREVDELESVIAHLQALLNSHVGSSVSSPSYGLPDFNDMVHEMPEALRTLRNLIRDCVLEHEPRLGTVRVQQLPSADPLRLTFEIVARLRTDRRMVRLRTNVHAGGRFSMHG